MSSVRRAGSASLSDLLHSSVVSQVRLVVNKTGFARETMSGNDIPWQVAPGILGASIKEHKMSDIFVFKDENEFGIPSLAVEIKTAERSYNTGNASFDISDYLVTDPGYCPKKMTGVLLYRSYEMDTKNPIVIVHVAPYQKRTTAALLIYRPAEIMSLLGKATRRERSF